MGQVTAATAPGDDLLTEEAPAPGTRTAAVIVPQWRLLAALDRALGRQEDPGRDAPGADGQVSGSGTREGAATGQSGTPPVILVERHRVVHTDAAAAAAGVAVGMRRRSAQAACPDALVLETDREHETSLFELVAAAVDTVAAGVDVLRPGVVLMASRGPARHRGGEERLAEAILDAVADHTGWECQVGIADGPFAALLAARTGRIIRPGRSAEYLAPHDITLLRHAPVGPDWGHRDRPAVVGSARLDLAEATDLFLRLGITTLGDLAALPATSVLDRFGPDAAQLHLLSRGGEPTPPAMHRPEQPIEVLRVLEDPLVRSDQAAFAARPMAEELHGMLVARGLICTRLRIIGRTVDGEEMERTWRHDGELSPADVVDRVRWQCDGWLTGARLGRTRTGAIAQLLLQPVQLMPAGEGAAALWGSAGEAAQRAGRAFARAQGLAGEDAVMVPAPVGGRLLADQVRWVPWRSEKPASRPGPWPGSLPRPLPATVLRTPPPVDLQDAEGRGVVVTSRGLLSATPVALHLPPAAGGGTADSGRTGSGTATDAGASGDGAALAARGLRAGSRHRILGHGSPVLLDERWWGPSGRRAARMQLVIAEEDSGPVRGDPAAREASGTGERALLVLSREGRWQVEGIYD